MPLPRCGLGVSCNVYRNSSNATEELQQFGEINVILDRNEAVHTLPGQVDVASRPRHCHEFCYDIVMDKPSSPEDPEIWSLQLRLMEALAHAEHHDPVVAAHIEAALTVLNARFKLL